MSSPSIAPTLCSVSSSPITAPVRAALREIWWYVTGSAQSRRRQRDMLAEMDARLRRDIGLPDRQPPASLHPWTGPGMPGW
ncbi:protein of unknown function [Rhodovastum atsumiense]|nr:protein of unknown function [Rhodovastum atsumiense]